MNKTETSRKSYYSRAICCRLARCLNEQIARCSLGAHACGLRINELIRLVNKAVKPELFLAIP